MRISFIQVKEIFNTLPIGYYLGRAIDTELDEMGSASYFNPGADKIVISYPMIRYAVGHIDSEVLSTEAIEEVVRGLLYHEISHVILTPENMRMNRILNIVEDERIESLCKSVYMNTNFFKNLLLINNYNGEAPTDVDDAFYHLVRFHVGEEYWLKRCRTLLKKYARLNHDSEYYENYVSDVKWFYREFCDWYNEQKEKEESNNSENTEQNEEKSDGAESEGSVPNMDEETTEENNDTETVGEEENNEEEKATTENNTNETSSTENRETENTNSEETETPEDIDDMSYGGPDFKEIAENVINKYHNNALTGRLLNIINEAIKKNKHNGAAINAYSGRLNPRAVADRDDYKWWTAQNRMGHLKQNSRVHFNLFIDNSGSFRHNARTMNQFIKALDKIEKQVKDFTFDVITIGSSIIEWEDHNKEFHANGGNRLGEEIADVIKRHTKPNCSVYNIVLFDGDAHCNDYLRTKGTSMDTFRHFSGYNNIIVSDRSNECYIKPSVTKTRVIYTTDYCREFIDRVCETLKRVL